MVEPTRFDREIGERAAHIRNILSLPQQTVAESIGVTRQTMANYESGKTPMRAGTIRALCETYGVPASWLLGIDDELYHKSTVNGRRLEIREKSPSIGSPLADE